MEWNTKWMQGIIGTILLLVGWGGSNLLSVDIVDNTFVCNSNDRVGIFKGSPEHKEPLSKTLGTGYWVDESGSNRRSRCSGGQWEDITSYATSRGVSLETFVEQLNVEIEKDPVKCEPTVVTNTVVGECKGQSVGVVAYVPNIHGGIIKYYCDGVGVDANCEASSELSMPFSR